MKVWYRNHRPLWFDLILKETPVSAQDTSPSPPERVLNVLGAFLAAPPEGTPPELVEELARIGGTGGDPLPPSLFFEAVEQSPLAISITDAKATILYANRAFEALTGYAREEVIGCNESILSNNATPRSVYEQLWRTIGRRQTWTGTLVNRTRAGGDYLAELIISPVLDDAGEPRYFLGMQRDVTKMHQLEAALRQQKARIETVLDAAPVIMVLLDCVGRVILDNQEYKRLLGDLRGREPLELFAEALRAQAGVELLACCGAGEGFKDVELSLSLPGSGGTRWFSCSATPVDESEASARSYFGAQPERGEHRLLLLANDITQRRREIERAHLENLRARLAEQQLMHGMREALAAAIYQIQGPLNLIQAAAGMMRSGGGHADALAGMLEQISRSGAETLAALSAALPEEPREAGVLVNVNTLLRQVLEIQTERLLANGIVVDWRPAPLLPEFPGHKNQLRAMFKQLIDNAIQALGEGRRAQRELRLSTRALDGEVEILIEDNGPGIAPEERYRVFEPFRSGWRNRRGRAGMGLALAQEIVNAHGGSIEVDPDFTDGCRIRLSLNTARKEER